MSQQIDLELLPREERIKLAIKAIKSNANLSQRRAAAVYNVPESTLQRQRAKLAS
jgi:DNA-binding transcriptional regulator YiaG